MKRVALLAVIFLAALYSDSTRAGPIFDNSLAYFGRSGGGITSTSLFENFVIGAFIGRYAMIGWNSNYIVQGPGGYSSIELGPKFAFYMGKNKHWSFGLAANPFVTGAVKGMSFQADLGYAPLVGKRSYAGFKIVGHQGSYKGRSVFTVLPVIFYSLRFDNR